MRMGGFHLRAVRSRPVAALALAALTALACAVIASSASASVNPFLDSPLPSNPFAHAHDRYINPFTDPDWYPERTDMGVDWGAGRKLPVLAIGDAVILGSSSHAGWPDGKFIFYALLNGDHAGDIVYVAEHLKNLLPAGRYVRAGQQIATALPGSPGTEWGWATPYGGTVAGPCYTFDGKKTAAGKEMARFMLSLGAHVQDQPGPGPDQPQGGRCS
jgi:murein DD-endopeptidase MepM/ murein hydrolase activator NlpD